MSMERELLHTPDGVMREDFITTLSGFESVSGPDNVLTGEERPSPLPLAIRWNAVWATPPTASIS